MDEAEREPVRLVAQPIFKPLFDLLETMPGVGLVTAATVIAEIGDFARFPDRKAIVRYVGLNPRTFESADVRRGGRLSNAGPPDVRWVLQQASWTAIRCDDAIGKLWRRIAKRVGNKAAAVAVARHMLMWMWSMARHQEPFRRKQAA